MWDSVCILADDLTGLAETIQAIAEPLHQKALGYTTTVHPLPLKDDCLSLEPFSVAGCNTNHRACTVGAVKRSTLRWVNALPEASIASTFLYQKMDSTLRGWWAEEANQWIISQAVGMVWCCPAYPQQVRTTSNSFHFLHNTPLHQTAMATDPTHAISTNDLTAYLKEVGVPTEQILKITVPEIETIRVDEWVKRLQNTFQEKQISWILQDATTPEHLNKMAMVVHQLKQENHLPTTLFLGAGGWAGALANCTTDAFEQNSTPIQQEKPKPLLTLTARPKLVVSGSLNPATLEQLAYLKQSNKPTHRWVSMWQANGGLKLAATILQQCLAVAPNETLILTTCTTLEERSGNALIQETLSTVLSQLFQTIDFKKIICCGGDTSLLTLKAANARLLQWHPQGLSVQFPQLTSDSGYTWVFKSGNMGEKEALYQLLQTPKQETS